MSRLPVDHAWVDDHRGVLSCVAGDIQTRDQLAVCPYYLRTDVVDRLEWRIRGRATGRRRPPTLHLRNGTYHKVTDLAAPRDWHRLVDGLPAVHGLRPFPWSLFTGLSPAAELTVLDPRDCCTAALRGAVRPGASPRQTLRPRTGLEVLAGLAARLGDPGNAAGHLGLTGSAALDPTRLAVPPTTRGADIDVIAYPPITAEDLTDAVHGMGGRTLADLAGGHEGDPRAAGYMSSRLMPTVTDPFTARTLAARRTDVAWFDDLRLDLTVGAGTRHSAGELPYARPSARKHDGTGTVAAVRPGYPVRLDLAGHRPGPATTGDHPRRTSARTVQILVTARAFQGCFRVADRLRYTGSWHPASAGCGFISVDDAAGHQLALLPDGKS